MTPFRHTDEPCHAVVVSARHDGTVVEMPVCTEPKRHRGYGYDAPRQLADDELVTFVTAALDT